MSGHNPKRHKCQTDGCWIEEVDPKKEAFDQCYPRKITMSDVDGIVNIGWNFKFMEWKRVGQEIPDGQRIWHERITDSKPKDFVVFQVWGDPKTMKVDGYKIVRHGIVGEYIEADLEALKKRFSAWAGWADVTR